MNEGIVLELQREAMDANISLEALLRKAFLVAKKLKLEDFEDWIYQEQNGYTDGIPSYRRIVGELKAFNPYHGWITIMLPADLSDTLSKMSLATSISAIFDVYNQSNGSICVSINSSLAEKINNILDDDLQYKIGFFVSKSEFYRIMSTVRNKILEWALLLEENGIIGEGMSFSEKEKKIAQEAKVLNQYVNNFYGDVNDIEIEQG